MKNSTNNLSDLEKMLKSAQTLTEDYVQNSTDSSDESIVHKYAVALKYQKNDLPRVVAKGNGYVAQNIIKTAEESNVPIHQDPALAKALSALDIQQAIPKALFSAVAQVLLFAFEVKRKKTEAQQPTAKSD